MGFGLMTVYIGLFDTCVTTLYDYILILHTLQSVEHTLKCSQLVIVLTGTVSKGGHFPSSGFPSCPQPEPQ
jgi:hypothetical protein